uniref:GntR family transcriptional regulator n=1 Tax=Ndongobacter massiliensis TaxID=1871025 RepID=UPI000931E16E|nr:GntR family transcriptional regulator [Ndongobacter massiliensis]
MNIQIKNSSNDPIYLQIKNQLRNAILMEELAADEPLPSIRVLAKELRVSVITTKRAYDELEKDGYIHSVQGKGSFVAPQNKALVREGFLKKTDDALRSALHYARLANLTREEFTQLLKHLEEDHAESN